MIYMHEILHYDRARIENRLRSLLLSFPNLRELHLHERVCGSDRLSPTIIKALLSDLPCLEHLEFGTKRVCILYGSRSEHVPQTFQNSRILHLGGVVLNQIQVSDMITMMQHFPNLKHFEAYVNFIDNMLHIVEENDFSGIDSIESLWINMPKQHRYLYNIKVLLPRFPNLTALRLTWHEQQVWPMRHNPQELSNIATACPKLKVLLLRGLDLPDSFEGITQSICELKHLSVLALFIPSRLLKLSNTLATCIAQKLTGLQSFLGVEIDATLEESLCYLKYKSSPHKPSQTLMIRRNNSEIWVPIRTYSPEWREACGTEFFYPTHSLPNFSLVRHVRENFRTKQNHPCVNLT